MRNAIESIHADRERITIAFRQEVMGQKKLVLPVRELQALNEAVRKREMQKLKIG